MRWSITTACAALMLACGATTHGEQKSAPAKYLQFDIRVLEGDPLGSVEAGTINVLSQPRILTLEKQECLFFDGQEIPSPGGAEQVEVGMKIRIKPGTIEGGKVRLDIRASHSTLESQSKECIEIRTDEARAITMTRLGGVVKLRMDKGDGKRQKWVEVTVAEAKP